MLTQYWRVAWDNVSYLSEEMSDLICQGITGQGMSDRTLFTDDEASILQAQRIFTLNGTNCCATRSDLLGRTIVIDLDPIPDSKCRKQTEIEQAFKNDQSFILGGIFDTLSKALRIRATAHLSGCVKQEP